MPLDEEIIGPKRPSPKGHIQDLPQQMQSHHESLHSTCPICLGTFDNMLYLSPCLHGFCFLCTQDLLETKTDCPSCKQPFDSVFHPVKVKWHCKELPSLSPTRHDKVSSPSKKCFPKKHISLSPKKHKGVLLDQPTKKHCKELYIPLSDRKDHAEDPISLTCKDKSPSEKLGHPLSSPVQKIPPLSKTELSTGINSHKPCSIQSSSQDDSFPRRPKKCPHCSVIGEKPNSESVQEDEEAQNTTASLPRSGDCNHDGLYYYSTPPAKLSRPNILEATLMVFSSGILLFVCLYTYLSLILLHK